MPFVRKSAKKVVKRNFKKKGTGLRKGTSARGSLVSLIKKISLKNSETKHTHNINENVSLNHNSPDMSYNHLNTTQAVTDNNQGAQNFACRVGDEVIARGISYKFWFANKLDRPNVMYKIAIFRYKSGTTPAVPAPYFAQGLANYMIRDFDIEQFKILKVITFNLQTNAQRIITVGGALVGAEGHRAVSIYIPLKNQKLKYENGTATPRFTDIGYSIVAYDSFGTVTTDTIASFSVNRKFYFKDP